MQGLGFAFRSEAGLTNLASEVIASSAIEGMVFDPASVRSSFARRMGLPAPDSAPPAREVEGAVDMMLDATQKSSEPLTVDRLLGWQASLFPAGRSGLHHVLTGRWRTPEMDPPMQVVSGPIREPVRRKNIHFEAPAAKRIPGEVDAFLRWFEGKDAGDWILRAALAHLWFVTLHPFEDGNGRLQPFHRRLGAMRADGARSCVILQHVGTDRGGKKAGLRGA